MTNPQPTTPELVSNTPSSLLSNVPAVCGVLVIIGGLVGLYVTNETRAARTDYQSVAIERRLDRQLGAIDKRIDSMESKLDRLLFAPSPRFGSLEPRKEN